MVQLVCENTIVGSDVRRYERAECRIKNDHLSSLQLQRLSGLMKKAAELLDGQMSRGALLTAIPS